MNNTQNKTVTLSHEQFSKVVTSAVFAYVTCFTDETLGEDDMKGLYEATLEDLQREGLLEEFIEAFDMGAEVYTKALLADPQVQLMKTIMKLQKEGKLSS